MRDIVGSLVEAGIDPAVVGEMVRAAVQENRFWVLPHEEVKPAVLGRAQRIADQVNPAFNLELFGQA
jgi:hypothetical protein